MNLLRKFVFLVLCFFSISIQSYEIVVLQGKEGVGPYLDDLAALALENYSVFPYLVQSTLEDEKEYLSEHLLKETSLVIVAKEDGNAIGAITGHPFSLSPDRFTKTFHKLQISTEEIFYLGDIILKKEYRGQKIGQKMYAAFLDNVLQFPAFTKIALCEVNRSKDDPRRPSDYFSLDGFWTRRGFVKHPELNCILRWQEQGEEEESPKQMVFWIKEI